MYSNSGLCGTIRCVYISSSQSAINSESSAALSILLALYPYPSISSLNLLASLAHSISAKFDLDRYGESENVDAGVPLSHWSNLGQHSRW